MATVERFEDLEIWKLARVLYQHMSLIADGLRKKKEFRFADQVRSAAGSIMDNIAEGFERNSRLEFLQSLSISKGECGENRSQLYRLLHDKHITNEEFKVLFEITENLSGKIANLMKYLNRSVIRGIKFKDRK